MVLPTGYIPGFVCTLSTCSVAQWGFIHYQPSLPGNVLFLVLFAALAVAQLGLGIYYRTRLVCAAMLLGLACETLGYVARVLMHGDPFQRATFLWQLITLTIGPAFMAGAVYLCLGRIVVVYEGGGGRGGGEGGGEGWKISRFRPRWYTIFFMGCDFFSLVVQALGGGIAASVPLTNTTMINLGTHILVAGLSIQVASLFFFSVCSLEFAWRVRHFEGVRSTEHADLYTTRRFGLFLCSLALSTTLLFIRTVFRSVELSGGFGGPLANNQVQFMILDGTMVILACICMTVLHPGLGFGGRGGKWREVRFGFGKGKNHKGGEEGVGVVSAESGSANASGSGEKVRVGGEEVVREVK